MGFSPPLAGLGGQKPTLRPPFVSREKTNKKGSLRRLPFLCLSVSGVDNTVFLAGLVGLCGPGCNAIR